MKKNIKIATFFTLVCLLGTSGTPLQPLVAGPRLQEEQSELEQMILKRIEARKKELEAEQNSGKSSKNNSLPKRSSANNKTRDNSRTKSKTGTPKSSPFGLKNTPIRAATVPGTDENSGSIPRVKAAPKEPQFTEPTEMRGASNSNVDPNVKIRFNFVDEEWKDVIEWFADEVGYGIFFGQTGPPQGTFTYFDSNERNIIEALDFLNSRLAILQPSHVLIRNGNQLVLVNESVGIHDEIVARIYSDELKDFGEYEIASCIFDLGKLNGNQIAMELREDVSQVHLDGFAYLASVNHLTIRERVRVLRRFDDIIRFAKSQFNLIAVTTYNVKHLEPEVLLITLRQLMGFAEGSNFLEDGSLSFSVQPLGDIIYLKGTPDRVDEFNRIAEMIDVPFDPDQEMPEKPYFQVHRVSGDPEVVFQIVQTILDGEPNVRLDQDPSNGNLYILGPKSVHDKVSDLLNTMTGDGSFDIVDLKNLRPSDAVTTIENLLGLDGFDETVKGPKLVPDSDNNRIFVHGTPQEIILVRSMIEKIDMETAGDIGPRKRARFIPASPRKSEDAMNLMQIPGMMDSIGHKNRLNLILPQDRDKFRNRIRFNSDARFGRDDLENERTFPSDQDHQSPSGSTNRSDNDRTKTNVYRNSRQYETTNRNSGNRVVYVSSSGWQQEEPISASQPTDQIGQVTEQDAGFQQVDDLPSVPGAPIEARMTEQGIMLISDDLDALDDLEMMILDWVDSEGVSQLPSFFYLQYRKVDDAKSLLDHVLGLESSSGGGGGGGIGGLLGGAVSNAVGGAAGDALSGLLGGGGGGFGSSSDGAIELEGENVRIGTDMKFNTLIVTGATSNDIDIIAELIEYLDQPGPPQKRELIGKTYTIKIYHRDPMDVKEIVELQLGGYFNKSNAAGGNQNQNPQQQIQQQVLRQLAGGGKKGSGGSKNSGGDQPKATLGVDEITSSLLVTGPEFIYLEVVKIVQQIDVKDNKETRTVANKMVSPDVLVGILKSAFGPMVVTPDDTEEDGVGGGGQMSSQNTGQRGRGSRGGNTGASNRRNSGGAQSRPNNRSSIERAIQDAVRQRGNPGGGRNFQPRR